MESVPPSGGGDLVRLELPKGTRCALAGGENSIGRVTSAGDGEADRMPRCREVRVFISSISRNMRGRELPRDGRRARHNERIRRRVLHPA